MEPTDTSSSETTDSASSSADTVVHVETSEDGRTTRRVVREYTQGTGAETKTVTTIKESRPGESFTTVRREFYTMEMPTVQTRTITRTIGGTLREITSDTSRVIPESSEFSSELSREGSGTMTETKKIYSTNGASPDGTRTITEVREIRGTPVEITRDGSGTITETKKIYTTDEASANGSRTITEVRKILETPVEITRDGSATITETKKIYTTDGASADGSRTITEVREIRGTPVQITREDGSQVITERTEIITTEEQIIDSRGTSSSSTSSITETSFTGNSDDKSKTTTVKSIHPIEEPSEIDPMSAECETVFEESEIPELDISAESTAKAHEKILLDKLDDAAIALSNLEPRVKMRDSSISVKTLIRERDQVEVQVNKVLKQGRSMVSEKLFGQENSKHYMDRLDQLERRMKLLKLWPIRDLRSVSNYDKLLDDKLKVVEATHSHLEPHIKYCFTLTDVEPLVKERDDFELKATNVIHIFRNLINDKVISEDKEKHFTDRINQLEKKTKKLTLLPIRELNRITKHHKYLGDKLSEIESEANKIEPRIKNSNTTGDNEELVKDRETLKDKVYTVLSVGRSFVEHGILDKIYETRLVGRMDALEKRTNMLRMLPINDSNRTAEHQNQFLEEMVEETEDDFSDIENMMKNSITSKDNTMLIKHRNEVKKRFYNFKKLLQEMINKHHVDKDQSKRYVSILETMEKRLKVTLMWPLKELESVTKHNKYLKDKLDQHAKAVTNFEPQLKHSARSSVDNTHLIKERDDLNAKVQSTVKVGRHMISQGLTDKSKSGDREHSQRINQLEKKLKALMMWPIIGRDRLFNKEEFLVEKLNDLETDVSDIEPRIKKKVLNASEIEELCEEREDLELKANGVTGFGECILEDTLFQHMSSKDYKPRMDSLAKRVRLIKMWPVEETQTASNIDKFLKDKLLEAENKLSRLYANMRQAIKNKDNKDLIRERDDIDRDVQDVIALGRGMVSEQLFDQGKASDHKKRIDGLEKRMKLIKGWPIQDQTSTFLVDHIHKAEIDVTKIEQQIKQKNLRLEDAETLTKECEDLERNVLGVIGLGRVMLEEKMVDKKKEEEYSHRLDEIEKRITYVMDWPIIIKDRREDYNKYYENKLIAAETSLEELAERYKKTTDSKNEQALNKERDELDVQVYAVTSLGRGMIEDKFFDEKREKEYDNRISNLERAMEPLRKRPVGKKESSKDVERILNERLKEAEKSIKDFEKRIKKEDLINGALKKMVEERDRLVSKVNDAIILVDNVVTDKLVDSKKASEYATKTDDLKNRTDLLRAWPYKEKALSTSNLPQDLEFDEQLSDAEMTIANMEPRVTESIHNKDNKELIKERDQLYRNVYNVTSLGRRIAEEKGSDKDTDKSYQTRIDNLERRMRLLMGWPILEHTSLLMGLPLIKQASTRLSLSDRVRFLDHNLEEAEKNVASLETRLKRKNPSQSTIEALTKERDDLEPKVVGVIGLGNEMIKDKLVDMNREKEYLQRFKDLQTKRKTMMIWPIIVIDSNEDYDRYLEVKLTEVESAVDDMEPRSKQPIKTDAQTMALLEERDDLEMNVHAVTSMGRGMIEEKLIDENKEKEYSQRIFNLERVTKLQMIRPIRKLDSSEDYNKYLEEKLTEVETFVGNVKQRIKKPNTTDAEQMALVKERDELEIEVYAVTNLGRGMFEDQVFDEKEEKEHSQRISNLERGTKLLMMRRIGDKERTTDKKKEFDEELLDVEIAFSSMESRVKKAIHNKDNKDLMKERDDLDHNVHDVTRLGRGMAEAKVFDKDKDMDYQKRMDDLERKMRLLMGWPILEHTSLLMSLPGIEQASTRLNVHDRVRFLDHKLQEAEKDVENLQTHVRQKNLTQDEVETLTKERDNLKPEILGVIGLGNGMIKDNLVHMTREKEYLQRFEDLQKKTDELMLWPIMVASDEDYNKYYEDTLTEVETAVSDLEQRMKKSIESDAKQTALIEERDVVEMKVYAVSSLGRGMIDDRFLDQKNEKEHNLRISSLGRAMKLLMMRPVGKMDSDHDYDEHLEGKLTEVETSLGDLKQRIKKPRKTDTQQDLSKERDDVEMKVYAVTSLGRGIIEDKLVEEDKQKEHNHRISNLERSMGLLTMRPLGEKPSDYDEKKEFDEELLDVEIALSSMESRVKKAIHNKDNKDLTKGRDDLYGNAHDVIRLGRGMADEKVFDKDKEIDCQKRMDDVERRMRLLMGWPILEYISLLMSLPVIEQASTRLGVNDRVRFLDHKLHETEKDVVSFEQRVKKKNLTQDKVEALTKERDNLESKVVGVIGLGNEMIKDKLVDMNREVEYLQRFIDLQMKMKTLMIWPIIVTDRYQDYDKYFENKLREVKTDVSDLEPRIKKPTNTESEHKALIKERDDLEMKAYAVTSLGRGMIEDKFTDHEKEKEHSQRMLNLERVTKVLMMRPIRKVNSDQDYHKYYEEKLTEVETAVGDLEPEIKKPITTDAEQQDLIKNRDELDSKVFAVSSLGRAMMEDGLIDEQHNHRISILERAMKLLMVQPIRGKESAPRKEFHEELLDAELLITSLESRVKKAIHDKDNKDLINERNCLYRNVHDVIRLGRGMAEAKVFDKDKHKDYQTRMDALERRMRLLMGWPILEHTRLLMGLPVIQQTSTRLSVHDRVRFLDHNLQEAEKDIVDLEQRIKKKNITKDVVEILTKERDNFESKVVGVIGLGNEMIKDKLVHTSREEEYLQRFEDLSKKNEDIMLWPIIMASGEDYNRYFEDKIKDVETAVGDLEPRIKESIKTDAQQTALIEERDEVEMKVYAVSSLGRGMIGDRFFDHQKEKEYSQRISKLERSIKVLKMRPIGKLDSNQNYNKYFEDKLTEIETSFGGFKQRIKKLIKTDAQQTDLPKERDDIEVKVYAVTSLGRGMIEDDLIDEEKEKEYSQRISNLERATKLLMTRPLGEKDSTSDHKKEFDEELLDVEIGFSSMESRVKKAIHNKDNKDLTKARDDLYGNVHDVVRLGRGMADGKLFDKDKVVDYHSRIDDLERRMRLLMGWPILEHTSLLMLLPVIEQASTRLSVHDRVRFLDHKLDETEKDVDSLEPRLRQKNLTKDEVEALTIVRDNLEPKVIGVIGLGNGMIKDKLVHMTREKEYLQRFEDLQKKMKTLMIWPIIIKSRYEDYAGYFEGKLTKVETAVRELEPRIKKPIHTAIEQKVLIKERDDVEMKVYAVSSLGRGMIEDKFFDHEKEKEHNHRISNLKRSMKLLMIRPIGTLESVEDYSKYFEDKLTEVETAVGDLEPRIKKAKKTDEQQTGLISDRDDIEIKVYAVSSLGRGMMEDGLIDENKQEEYRHRISTLERAIKLLMLQPIRRKTSIQRKEFHEELLDAELLITSLESRLKKAIHNHDNKDLIDERDDLDHNVHDVIRLGRGMAEAKVFDKDKDMDYQKRMDDLERRMKLLMGWPILEHTSLLMGLPVIEQASTRLSVHDRVRFLDHKLEETEKDVDSLQPRVRKRYITENEEEILTKERENLEPKVVGVIGLGNGMIKDKLVHMAREEEYLQRFEDLQKKTDELMLWPIIIRASYQDYNQYFEDKLTESETTVGDLEPRIKEPIENDTQQKALMEERDSTEMKVYAVTSLGRGMIEDKFFDEEKGNEYEHRISKLERAMRLLMIRPIGTVDSNQDYEQYFNDKLTEVESAVGDLKPRINKLSKTEAQQMALNKERDEHELNVYAVSSLGRGMIEDQLFDHKKEKEYSQRISSLERAMKLLMWRQIGDKDRTFDHKKNFEEGLFDAETTIALLEPRVKKAIHNKDNKDLIDERDDLEDEVQEILRLDRGMTKANLLDKDKDKDKDKDYQSRMDALERRMKLLMGWPILEHTSLLMGLPIVEQASTRLSVHDRVRFLDHKLEEVEKGVDSLQPRVRRRRNLKQDKVEALTNERDSLESNVVGVIGLGCQMLQDNLVSKNREKELLLRFDRLEMKIKELLLWPLIITASDEDYDKYFEEKMIEVETTVGDMEPRVKRSIKSDLKTPDLIKERDDLEMKVYAVTSLGRGMIGDKFFDENKDEEYNGRISTVERAMKLLMIRPIGALNSDTDYDKYFEIKLRVVETAVGDLEPRIKESTKTDAEHTGLIEERNELEVKVYAVSSLGRGMIEEQLFDEKKGSEFNNRISSLDDAMKLLMMIPVGVKDSTRDHKNEFVEQLLEVEIVLSGLEPRVKRAIHNNDNKDLIDERENLDRNLHDVIRLGRGMVETQLFDKDKEIDYQKRMDALERRMRLLMGWPILEHTSLLMGLPIIEQASTRLSVHDRVRFLDHKLQETEKYVASLEPRLRQKNLAQVEVEIVTKERKSFEPRVYGVIGLGVEMIRDNLVDMNREKEYLQRFESIDMRTKELMLWPIILAASEEDYDKYFEEKITEVETSVGDLEPRLKKPRMTDARQMALVKERDNVEMDVYAVTSLGRGMIESKFLDKQKEKEYSHRIINLERAMKLLLLWPIGKLNSVHDREKFLEDNLQEAEEAVKSFEQRAKKKDMDDSIKEMARVRDQLISKVDEVIRLGRDMASGKLVDSKKADEYTARMDDLDIRIQLLKSWPHAERETHVSVYTALPYKNFDEQLTEMEVTVARFEPRVKHAIHNKDNKDLIKERDDLDLNVHNVIRLGRGMVEAQLFDKDKDIDYLKRMDALGRRMRLLIGWPILEYISRLIGIPILEQTGELLHFDDREKFLDEKLHEAEVDVHELEPRIKEINLTFTEREALTNERDNLEPNVLGVVGLGRKMIEDNLVDKKKQDGYRQRINDVEARMKLLMCWPFNDVNETHDAFFEDRLRQVEVQLLSLEDLAGKEDLDGDQIKNFIKERSDLENNVYRVTSLGRGMLEDGRFSDGKEQEYIDRMDDVEKRMRLLFDWPDGAEKLRPIPQVFRDYDTQLRKMEVIVSQFELRAKVTDRESFDLQSAKTILDNIKALICERDQLEMDVYEVLTEGRVLLQEGELNVVDMAFYSRRMNRLEERIRLLREWLQSEMIRLFSLYIILMKQHLERLHDWLVRAEVKMDLEDDIGPNHDAVVKQLEEHMEFHKEVGLFSTVNMILEIDMDDPSIDQGLHQDVKTLSERWAAVWNWSEERKNSLLAVIAGWEKFRQEEQKLYGWLVGKNEAIEMSDMIDISDEEQVDASIAILNSLIKEIKDREVQVLAFRETGEQLISDAQYHDKSAKPIRDEVNDFDECWRVELDRAQRRKVQLQEARQKFLQMADLKRDVNEWLEESEALINTAEEKRDEEEEEKFQNKIEIQCEEREFNQRRLDKINALNKELCASIERDSYKEVNYVVDLLNRRMQDASDNLEMCRDDVPLQARDGCCLVNYWKRGGWEPGYSHEIRIKD